MGVKPIDREFWKGKRVFVTGHMGFKGAWLCSLLAHIGVESIGFGRDERECLLYRELISSVIPIISVTLMICLL